MADGRFEMSEKTTAELEKLRGLIDGVDQELLKLLRQRLDLVAQVARSNTTPAYPSMHRSGRPPCWPSAVLKPKVWGYRRS